MLTWSPTPLDAPLLRPEVRSPAGFDPSLLAALVDAPGIAPLVDALHDPEVLVVTTGQQPGLFTGPLYVVHKALSAAALARVLSEQWGRRVVPIFWLAGDDHDFAEASTASWLDGDGVPTTWALPERPGEAPLTPMYREPLDDSVMAGLEALGAAIPASEFRESVLDWLGRWYRPGRTVAEAFGGALAELLAPAGIVCLDSTHAAVKRRAMPLMRQALHQAREIEERLLEEKDRMERAGDTVTVSLGQGATLVMIEGEAGRDRLLVDDRGFHARRSGERWSPEEIDRILEDAPDRFSPNVLLRPVMESALLPTVAYVAGPGELRYLPMATPLYSLLDVHRQLPVPRWSGLGVEARVDRVLRKFDVTLSELLAPGQELEARIARGHLPDEALQALARIREDLEREYDIVSRVATTIDPTLARPVGSTLNHALSGAADIEKKLISHQKKREATELSQIQRARNALQPGGAPQERVLTVAPLLARHGFSLLEDLGEEIERWYRDALAPAQSPS